MGKLRYLFKSVLQRGPVDYKGLGSFRYAALVLQIGPEPNITEVVGAIISFCASLVGVDLRTILAFSKTEGTNTRAEGFCGFKALISLSATRHHTAVVRTEAKVGNDLSTIGVSCSIIVGTEGCYFEVSVAKSGPSPVDVKISVIAVTIDNETVFSTICLNPTALLPLALAIV